MSWARSGGKGPPPPGRQFPALFLCPGFPGQSTAIPASVNVEEGKSYISIRGETLCRLYTQKPTDVRKYRESFSAYEADIPFTTRFMIDCGLTAGSRHRPPGAFTRTSPRLRSFPARVCMLDIECEDERGFPEPERDAIVCITCHDSYTGRYTSFIFSPTGKGCCDLSVLATAEGKSNGCFCRTGMISTLSRPRMRCSGVLRPG